FCNDLCEAARQLGLQKITADLVGDRAPHVVSAAGTLFQQIWSQELDRDQQRAMGLLCESDAAIDVAHWERTARQSGLTQERCDAARRGLQEIELVQSEGGKIRARIPLFRQWLVEARPRLG